MRNLFEDRILYAPEDGSGGGAAPEGGDEPEVKEDEAPEADGEEKTDTFSKLKGEKSEPEGDDGDEEGKKEGEEVERPEFVDKAYWDEKTGKVNVEQMANDLKATKKALRQGLEIPEPTEENPIGYDLDFVRGHGKEGDEDYRPEQFDEEYLKSEEFQAYALKYNQAGYTQPQFEMMVNDFNQYMAEYTHNLGLDLNPDEVVRDYQSAAVEKYGKAQAEKNWQLMERWSANTANVHPNIRRTLGMSAEGLMELTERAVGSLNKTGVTNKAAGTTGSGDINDIEQKLTSLRTERDKLPQSDPNRQHLIHQIRELTKEKDELLGSTRGDRSGREDEVVAGIKSTSASWAEKTANKQKFKKIGIKK